MPLETRRQGLSGVNRMRRVIDGKTYDTDTATVICDVSAKGFHAGDFRYDDSYLYKTPKGAFFVAGEGGPLSQWAQPEGNNGRRGGSGLRLVDIDDAKAICERHGSHDDYIKAFGEPEAG
jgi:hypothetical protein